MITPEYCALMARYNQWQNKDLRAIVIAMDEGELHRDRGAFFGSIFGTMNHLLWGDTLWMSRFDGGKSTDLSIEESVHMTPNLAEWWRLRFVMDGRIREWAGKLHAVDLVGDFSWFSGAKQAQVTKPLQLCIVHMFNHQTHHRGQIHAMLTAAGQTAGVSDLFYISNEG